MVRKQASWYQSQLLHCYRLVRIQNNHLNHFCQIILPSFRPSSSLLVPCSLPYTPCPSLLSAFSLYSPSPTFLPFLAYYLSLFYPTLPTRPPPLPPLLSPWDIRNCLFPQCALAGVSFPEYMAKWVDIRKLFSSFYQIQGGNLSHMLSMLGMQFEGREHCGLDDARNIARIAAQLLRDGCGLQYNRFIPPDLISSIFTKKR